MFKLSILLSNDKQNSNMTEKQSSKNCKNNQENVSDIFSKGNSDITFNDLFKEMKLSI